MEQFGVDILNIGFGSYGEICTSFASSQAISGFLFVPISYSVVVNVSLNTTDLLDYPI